MGAINCSQSSSLWRNGRHSWPASAEFCVWKNGSTIQWFISIIMAIWVERPLSDTPIYTTVAAQLTSCLALVNPKTHSEEPHRSLETDTLGVTQPRHTLYGPNHAKVWRSIGLATCVSGSWQSSSSVRPLPKELCRSPATYLVTYTA